MKVKSSFLLILLVVFFAASCDSGMVFDENKDIPQRKWNKDKAAVFKVEIQDTVNIHNVYVNVRNSGSYEYNNLFLFITTTAPGGAMIRDTFECALADDKGKWYGSGIGDIWSARVPYKMNIKFPRIGTYTFEIEQAMRVTTLEEIMDIGIRVEKH